MRIPLRPDDKSRIDRRRNRVINKSFNSMKWQCIIFVVLFLSLSAFCAAAQTKIIVSSRTDQNYPLFDNYMLEKFHQANPDIVVEIIPKSATYAIVQTYIAGGQQLDIAVLDPYIALELGQQGLAVNFEPYIKREERFGKYWYPPSLDAYRSKGGVWALPRDLQLPAVFYNANVFAETGLPLPRGRWTYEDVKNNAVRLQKTDNNGNVTRWGWKLPTWRNWVPIIWGYGADFYDSWAEPTHFVGNTSNMYEAFRFMRSLAESGAIADKVNHAKQTVSAAFIAQTIAMGNTNTITMGQFSRITDFEWDIAPAPYGPVGRKPYFNGLGWVILSTCKNPEAAWRLINFFTNEFAMENMIEILGVVPPDRRYINQWLAKTAKPANKQIFFEEIDKAGYPGSLETALYNLVEKEMLAVVWGEETVAAAIENMEQLANVRLAELKKQ